MSGNTWASVGVGIVFAAAVIFSGGTATAALFAFSLGATATGMVLGPETPKSSGLRPDEFQINQSSEDITVPVIFGTSRVSTVSIYVGIDDFVSKAVFTEQEGGKGGGSSKQQTGYTYTVPLAYGICMGEIDTLRRVSSSPGLDVWKDFGETPLEFTGGNAETFDLIFTKEQGDQTFKEGGSCTFYPGSPTQGSDANATDTNHREFCWVDFPRYEMTNNPSPITLLFEITRMPKVLDDEGTPILGFPTRASNNADDAEYLDANPAAVAWEILQNPIWGKGASVRDLDVDSFKTAALYYANKRIGISTAMGRTDLNEFMGRLRDIFGLWVWWDGNTTRCRAVWDRSTAYAYRVRISAEDIIDSPQFNRPSLSATYNEIRLEFTNRESNWTGEIATTMDLAHVETIQGVKTQTIDAAEIGTRRSAELIAHAMLRQMAYPGASSIVKLRRTYSGLRPGAFVEMIWDEWREGGTATTFWRVIGIDDDDQGSEGLTITLAEDLYATARDGEVANFDEPIPNLDEDDPLNAGDYDDGDLVANREIGSLLPVVIDEPNSWASQMNRLVLVAPTREKGYVNSVTVAWRHLADSVTTHLAATNALPITGTLLDAIPADGPKTSRDTGHQFRIQLTYAANAASFESATGLVQVDADHFSELTRSLQAMLLIGGEIYRVGFAEETAPGVMTIRTFMRAEQGSVKAAHPIGAVAAFFAVFDSRAFIAADGIPTSEKVVFTLQANSNLTAGSDDENPVVEAPVDGLGITLPGASVSPLAPELYSATRVGNTWTVKIRPRVWYAGAGYRASLQDDLNALVTDLSTLSMRVQKGIAGTHPKVDVPAGTSFATPPFSMPAGTSIDSLTWQPDDGSVGSGIITLVLTFDASPASLKIWGVRNGFASISPLVISEP